MPFDSTDTIHSSFGNDPDMSDLVEMFVDEMPDRIDHVQQLLQAADWDELGRFAHQMKGAAGSYGFNQLTPLAARVETAARGASPEATILETTTDLIDAFRRVRAGAEDP